MLKKEDWIRVWYDKSYKNEGTTGWDFSWIDFKGYETKQTSGTTFVTYGEDGRGEFLKRFIDIGRHTRLLKCIAIWRRSR